MQATEFIRAWRDQVRHWQDRLPARPEVLDYQGMEELFRAGTPLITAVQPAVSGHQLREALLQVGSLWARHAARAATAGTGSTAAKAGGAAGWPDLERVLQAVGPEELDRLAGAALHGHWPHLDLWARDRRVPSDLLVTLMELALQPFMTKFAAGLDRVAPLGAWRQNYCPVCGRQADLARIDPDNLRWLHCPLCDTQWQHYRLSCVWCNTDDTQKVELLTADGWEPWWVETCSACGGYIKTLDQRHDHSLARQRLDLFLEDARTLSLDLLAQREGFHRGGRVA